MTEKFDAISPPELFDQERLEDGRKPVKVGAPYDDSSVMIAVVITDSKNNVLITNSEEPSDDPVWYVPSGDVENGECLITAAKRHVFTETELELVNVRIASVENYPSLRRNFVRFIAIGDLVDGFPETKDCNKWKWIHVDDLKSGSAQLLSMDIEPVIRNAIADKTITASFKPVISSSALHFLSVQIGLVIDNQVLVVRKTPEHSWRLPFTFADYRSGESLPFASKRVFGRLLNIMPDVVGAVNVQHGFDGEPKPKEGHLGSCITVLAHAKHSAEEVESVLKESLDCCLWRFLSVNDVSRMDVDEDSLRIFETLIAGQSVLISSV